MTQVQLKEHTRRLSLNYQPDYADYIINVRKQQAKNPKFPKMEPAIQSDFHPREANTQLLNEILNEAYTFTGIVRLEDGRAFYEFAHTTIKAFIDYTDYRFLYAPIQADVTTALFSKLPTLVIWDASVPMVQKAVPISASVVDEAADRWPDFYTLAIDDFSHPYLPDLYMSGRVVVQRNGAILYEYFDAAGLYKVQDGLYMSTLRPINLDFPLGQPKELKFDICLQNLKGLYPTAGHINQIGTFTGYVTTSSYHPKVTFYLYEREDGSGFLSESRPSPNAESYIRMLHLLEIEVQNNKIKISSPSGVQTLTEVFVTSDLIHIFDVNTQSLSLGQTSTDSGAIQISSGSGIQQLNLAQLSTPTTIQVSSGSGAQSLTINQLSTPTTIQISSTTGIQQIQLTQTSSNHIQISSTSGTQTLTTPLPMAPDLLPENLTAPATTTKGSHITISGDVRNIGGKSSDYQNPTGSTFDVAFYLSRDALFSGGTDYSLGTLTLGPIASQAQTTFIQIVTLPTSWSGYTPPPANNTYYLLAVADPDQTVNEVSGGTANNVASKAIVIT